MGMAKLRLEHLAFPSFNAAKTHRFYTQVMGFPLIHAFSDKSSTWKKKFIMFTYAISKGITLTFFEYDGIKRPKKNRLPDDIYHVGLAIRSYKEMGKWMKKLKASKVKFYIEEHGGGDDHLYFRDPNGVLFELTVEEDALGGSYGANIEALKVVHQWSKTYL